MQTHDHGKIVYIVWFTLVIAAFSAALLGRWSMSFVALATLVVSATPMFIADRYHFHLPWPFFTGIVLFIFASLFLGEMLDFYDRYWWWDVALHFTSAIGFGLVGFVFVFAMFKGNRYAAPAWAIGFISMCVAMAIGVVWEIFEFTMDSTFGLNMQKSGLVDTMWDLIVDTFGAFISALAGFAYVKGRQVGGLPGLIGEFVRLNARLFRKAGRRK